jgi:hypothetical protein
MEHLQPSHEKVAQFYYFLSEKLIFIINIESCVKLNPCCVGGLSSGGTILTT